MNQILDLLGRTPQLPTTGWSAQTAQFAQQAALVTMVVATFLLAIALLSNLYQPAETIPVGGIRLSRAAPSQAGVPLPQLGRYTLQPDHGGEPRPGLADERAQVAVAAAREAAGATAATASRGLSPTDVIALESLRRRIESGAVGEAATAPQRLAFARWLVEHDRLAG